MRRSPFAPLVPFRGFTKPEWPYKVNLDSPQAEDLRFWFSGAPVGSGVVGVTAQAGPLDHVSGVAGVNAGSTDWMNFNGSVGGFGLGGGGSFTWTNAGEIIYPTTGITVLIHVVGASATNNAKVLVNGGASIGNYFPFSDGNIYWDFGGASSPNRLILTSPTFHNDDVFVCCAGARGTEIWQNGTLMASNATPITASPTSDLVLTSTSTSMLTEYRMNGVQFPQALCAQMSEPQGRWDLYAPVRQRAWVFFGLAGAAAVDPRIPGISLSQAVKRASSF